MRRTFYDGFLCKRLKHSINTQLPLLLLSKLYFLSMSLANSSLPLLRLKILDLIRVLAGNIIYICLIFNRLTRLFRFIYGRLKCSFSYSALASDDSERVVCLSTSLVMIFLNFLPIHGCFLEDIGDCA